MENANPEQAARAMLIVKIPIYPNALMANAHQKMFADPTKIAPILQNHCV
jgi:hypothetical protein